MVQCEPWLCAARRSTVGTQVIVKLGPDTAAAGVPARRALDACAAELGVSLTPLHPSTSDLDLATYFVADVEGSVLDRTLDRLRRCAGVEGAYAKPRGEPPERM